VTESRDAERYVAGNLSGEEAARFEEAMIAHPELAADVCVRRRIKAGLSQLEQNQELAALLKQEPSRPRYIRYAAAAAVFVVLGAGLMTFWNRDGAPLQAMFNASDIGAKPVASSFILATTRSTDVLGFEVHRDAGPVELRILVDATSTAPFTAHLTAKQSGTSFKDSSIAQITDGFAVVYLDPRALPSGDYTLALKSASGTEQIFPFSLYVIP